MGTPGLDEAKGWVRGQWEPRHWGLNRVPLLLPTVGEGGGQQHHPLILAQETGGPHPLQGSPLQRGGARGHLGAAGHADHHWGEQGSPGSKRRARNQSTKVNREGLMLVRPGMKRGGIGKCLLTSALGQRHCPR